MPFYFHPDIKTYNFQAHFLKQGVWNIYDYLEMHKSELTLKDEFVYFPFTYFFLGAYQIAASPFLGNGFESWISNANNNSSGDVEVFKYLFILKLPYLILDIFIGLILASFFVDFKNKRKALVFWLFNPFSVILLYVYSNVDIFPVFFSLLSLYFFKKNNFAFSALALGIGGAFKAFPILLVPFLLTQTSRIRNKLLVLICSFGVFGLAILPFMNSVAFKQSTLASGLTTRIISSGLNIGFGEILMPALVLLSVLFFWALGKGKLELWRLYLTAFIFTLISIHFHIHWLLWIIPFLTLLYVADEDNHLIVPFLLIAFCIPLLYTDKFMTVGLLKAISPLYELLPTPSTIVGKVSEVNVILGILHSILFGLGLLLSLKVLKK